MQVVVVDARREALRRRRRSHHPRARPAPSPRSSPQRSPGRPSPRPPPPEPRAKRPGMAAGRMLGTPKREHRSPTCGLQPRAAAGRTRRVRRRGPPPPPEAATAPPSGSRIQPRSAVRGDGRQHPAGHHAREQGVEPGPRTQVPRSRGLEPHRATGHPGTRSTVAHGRTRAAAPTAPARSRPASASRSSDPRDGGLAPRRRRPDCLTPCARSSHQPGEGAHLAGNRSGSSKAASGRRPPPFQYRCGTPPRPAAANAGSLGNRSGRPRRRRRPRGRRTFRMLSQYSRAEDAPVRGQPVEHQVVQQLVAGERLAMPSQSVHARNFSTIHAHSAAGESTRP